MAREIAEELRGNDPNRYVEFVIADRLLVQADPRLIRVAMTNLLGNAWKFTAKRPAGRIEFGQTQDNGVRTFFVRDNGAGFDMAYADKLFGAFQRLHAGDRIPRHRHRAGDGPPRHYPSRRSSLDRSRP